MKWHDFKRSQEDGSDEDMCYVCRNHSMRLSSYAYDHEFLFSDLCGWTRGHETYTELVDVEEL